MRTRPRTHGILLLVAAAMIGVLPAGRADLEPTTTRNPTAATPDEAVRARADLLSLEACRAEFRWLGGHWRKLDLAAEPVHTDGWTTNIAQAEWPVMGLSYFGYSAANLAQADQAHRQEYLDGLRWVVKALQNRRIAGFMKPHFGEPFSADNPKPAVFLHGHFLNVAMRYRAITDDGAFDPQIHRVADLLARGFDESDQAILPSYPDMWWLTDNFPAMSALARYDAAFGKKLAEVGGKLVSNIRAHYLDPKTGMFCTYVQPAGQRSLQGARGISQMYGLHFLQDFAPEFAAEQYKLAGQHLFTSVLGIPGVREFPAGATVMPDIDSGPLVFGMGPSASGFAVAAAATMGDRALAGQLARAAGAVGVPMYADGQLTYALMPAVGQAVILYGKTLRLTPVGEDRDSP